MTQSGSGNNNFFPAFNGFFVQSLGLQGIPGSCPSNLAASNVEYGPATSCVPASLQTVDAMLAWFETNVACVLDPASILAAPDGYILVWDATQGKLVPMTVGAALGAGLPGTTNNDVLLYNTLSSSYVPTSLLTWLTSNLPTVLPDAFDGVFPCTTPGNLLGCTANGWASTSFRQAFNTGLPGTNNFDLAYWNSGTNTWQVTDAGSILGNNLPAALAAAFPCTSGDLISCVGGQWQSTTFQAAMNTGLPGNTASDIAVWNGSQWVPTEEQVWLAQVLGPALGNQSITALSDTPAVLGSPGQFLATNAASTGTVWTTIPTGVTTFVGLTDTPATLTPNTFMRVNAAGNALEGADLCTAIGTCSISSLSDVPALGGPLQIARVNAVGSSLEFTDICGAIATCSITSLSDAPPALGGALQIMRMNALGNELEFADICTAIGNCSITSLSDGPPALGGPNQILKMNPAGTDLVFSDVCTEIAACSITALSDTPAALGAAGTVLTVNPGGTGTIWSAIAAGGALPAGVAGDMVFYNAAGTTGTAGPITDYLDTYYPPPAGSCNAQLTNSGAGWVVAEGIPAPPGVWGYPLAPQSVGLELETNPVTRCAEWVKPSHVAGTFAVPGDFPSVQEFITWAEGLSVDVVLNVTIPQAGITFDDGPTGKVEIRANGNNIGELVVLNSGIYVVVNNAAHNSIYANQGKILLTNPASFTNTSGQGILAENNGNVVVVGDIDMQGVGQIGIQAANDGFVRATGQITVNTANTDANIMASEGSTIIAENGLQVNNSAGQGIFLEDNSTLVTDNAAVTISNNASYGVLAINSSSVSFKGAVPITVENNGIDGISVTTSTSLFVQGATVFDVNNNGAVGLNVVSSASASIFSQATGIDGNTTTGLLAGTGASLTIVSPAITISNSAIGVLSSGFVDLGGAGNNVTIQNNQVGISAIQNGFVDFENVPVNVTANVLGTSVAIGGKMTITGGTIAGNTTNSDTVINTLSPTGGYIQV